MFSLLASDMTTEDILRKRSKTSRTKKTTREDEKKKTPIIVPEVLSYVQYTPVPELDVPPPKPEAPQKAQTAKENQRPEREGNYLQRCRPLGQNQSVPCQKIKDDSGS